MNPSHRWVARVALFGALVSFVDIEVQAQNYVFGTASYSAPGLTSLSTSPPQANAPILTADFNGDGIPDVAMLGTDSTGQVLSIFLGRPDGTFAPKADYSVQGDGFTLGDFNGDGKLDVIVATGSILLGNGDGTLQPPVPLNQNVINIYSAAASGDFNGDGKLDLLLLTPDFGSGATMAILLGNGDGTFQAPATYPVPVAPYLVVSDFNHDGRPDIAISGGLSGSGEVSILINKGDGTFKNPANYNISGSVQALAAADLNGDGSPDLVIPSGGSSAAISVLLGNGDGTFATPIVYTSSLLSIYSTSIAVADFNGDGKLDVALTNSGGSTNAVAVVSGNGDGTFQNPPHLYSAGLLPAAVLCLDINGDGKPDLAVAGGYGVLSYYSLTTLIDQGDGTFPNPITYPVLQFPFSAAIGDFNGDGHVDIVTTSRTQTGGVSTLLGKGDGTFQAHLDSPTGQSPTVIVPGDFNGDGKLDLVVVDSTTTGPSLSTLIGNGDGTFQAGISQSVPGLFQSLAAGDFNGDGKLDVAAVMSNTSAVSIFLGNGDGTFALPVQYPTGPMALSPPYHKVLVGDFNGDRKLDLAAATDNGIVVLLGNGNGTFQPFILVASLLSSDPGDELVALADVNGDGKLDVIKSTQTGIINVALGNGDGTFQQALGFQIPSILNMQSGVVGDFNGDGKLDIAFASQSSDVVTVLLGTGDGTFKGHIEYSVPSVSNNVDFMMAADFNGDGALDMALADFGSAAVSVFVNRPVAAFAPRVLKFANQGIDTNSPEQAVTVSNSGAAPLAIASIAITGDFSETDGCGSSLVVGNGCTVNVRFAPTADGARSGMLSFTDNASVVPQALVLSGTGTGAGFLISIAPGSSASQTVNAGQTASYSLVVTPVGGFNGTITLACFGAPTGANCTATPVSFPLTSTSAVTATINVATTALASSRLVPISMPVRPVPPRLHLNLGRVGVLLATFLILALLAMIAGRARQPARPSLTAATMLVAICAACGGGGGSVSTAPAAEISPSSLTFSLENQGTTSPRQSVILTNSGSAPLSITAFSFGGTNPGDFQQTDNCGSSVVAGGNCSIDVRFTPTATGSRSATLSIGDNATGSPQLVNLTGTGAPPATPTGTYVITVTAASGPLTQSTSLSLRVQ